MHFNPDDAGLNIPALSGAGFFGRWRVRSILNREEFGFIRRNLKPGQTALDLGANIGLYTLIMAKLAGPSGQVFAFEPGPKSYALLTKNIEVNGYANVQARNAAVSDRSGSITLHVCPTGESDNRVEGFVDPANGWERVTVPCLTIDAYMNDRRVDLIKMDIQGSEFAALKGMRRALEGNRDIKLVMEFSPDLIEDRDAFFQLIRETGLSIFDIDGKPATPEHLLATVGNPGQPRHTNIVLHR